MSQQTKITKVLEQLKNAEDKHVETVDALGENIGVYMADISNTLNEMSQVMMMSLTNTSALMENIMANGDFANEILLDQLLESRQSNGIADEEEEREDQQFKEGLSDKVEDIHDELKKGNKKKKNENKGFFKELMTVGAMMLGSLLKLALAPLKGLSKLIGRSGIITKIFGKGGLLARMFSGAGSVLGKVFGKLFGKSSVLQKIFGKGGFIARMFSGAGSVLGKVFGKGGFLAGLFSKGGGILQKIFGKAGLLSKIFSKIGAITGLSRLAPMLGVLGKIFVPLGAVIAGFKVISATISEFLAGGDPAAIISAGIGALIEFFSFGLLKGDVVKEKIEGPLREIIGVVVDIFNTVMNFFNESVIPFVMETLVPILKDIFGLLFKIFQDVVLPIAKVLFNLLGKIFKLIFSIVSVVFKILTPVIKLVGFLLKVVIEILKPIIAVVGWIVQGIGMIIGFVVDIITFVVDIVSGIIDFIMSPLEYISSAIEGITNFLSGVVDFISSAIMGAVELAKQVFLEPFKFIVEGIGSIFGFIKDKIDSLLNDEDSPLFGLGLRGELKKGREARAAQAALIENYSEDRHRRVFENLKGAGVLDPHVEFEDTPVQWGDFNKDWSWDDWTAAAQQVNAETPMPSMANQLSTPQQNAAQQIDTSDLDRASREAMAQISTQVVTNVQGGGGGGGGAIIAPSATRMNESSFRTQTQNGMVPAMEG